MLRLLAECEHVYLERREAAIGDRGHICHPNHETSETFTERVDVTTQPDGTFVGTLEIGVRHGDHQQDRVAALLDENSVLRAEVLTLRNRVRGLEAALASTVMTARPEPSQS